MPEPKRPTPEQQTAMEVAFHTWYPKWKDAGKAPTSDVEAAAYHFGAGYAAATQALAAHLAVAEAEAVLRWGETERPPDA